VLKDLSANAGTSKKSPFKANVKMGRLCRNCFALKLASFANITRERVAESHGPSHQETDQKEKRLEIYARSARIVPSFTYNTVHGLTISGEFALNGLRTVCTTSK
jgi:hypothetical protein